MTDLTALIAAAGADAVTLPAAPSPGEPLAVVRPAAPRLLVAAAGGYPRVAGAVPRAGGARR